MAAQSMTGRSGSTGIIIATGAALVSIAAAVFYLRNLQAKKKGRQSSNQDNKRHNNTTTVDPKIVELFDVAAGESKKLTKLSNTERLILYSLYKQSKEGDASPARAPSGFSMNLVDKAKFSAWERLQGMTTTQAMIHYIEGVQQLLRHGSIMDDGGMSTIDMDMMIDDLPIGGGLSHKPSTLAASEETAGFGDGGTITLAQQFLRAASENDRAGLERILNDKPELANHRDEDGQSALHLAADQGATDALSFLLIEAGADGNAADDDGITVLHAAVIGENVEACRLLLSHGANPDQADVDGDTPRKCAEEDGSDEMKKLFAGFK